MVTGVQTRNSGMGTGCAGQEWRWEGRPRQGKRMRRAEPGMTERGSRDCLVLLKIYLYYGGEGLSVLGEEGKKKHSPSPYRPVAF